IRIFLPTLLACSTTSTRRPRRPAVSAHISPAAPAPMTMTSACSVTATSRTGSAGGSHPHVRAQRHVAAFAHQLQLAILDQRVEPHPAFADRGHRVHDVTWDVDDGEVLQPREGTGDAVPPEVGGTPAVVHHHDQSE